MSVRFLLSANLNIELLRQNKQKRANVITFIVEYDISKVGSSGLMISKHKGQGQPSMKSTQTEPVADNMLTFFSCFVFLWFCERFLNQ